MPIHFLILNLIVFKSLKLLAHCLFLKELSLLLLLYLWIMTTSPPMVAGDSPFSLLANRNSNLATLVHVWGAESVDLKASKVCELGTLNHEANSAFYHLKKATFRCHYDYYWASIFEVQFEEYFSGQIYHAMAEAPKKALPHDCRPDFGTAWLTTMKFKVNETYGCKYLPGGQKVDIYSDDLFGCKAKQSSTSNPIMPFINLLTRLFIETEGSGSNFVYVARGFICGILVSMLTVAAAKCFRILAGAMARKQSMLRWRPTCIARLQRVCILVAYFSAMAWLILQYGKMIGLNQLLFDSKTNERTA